MTTVAIIGAGPLGRWLALEAARAGFRVFLEDVMPANLHHAQEYLREQLDRATLENPAPASEFRRLVIGQVKISAGPAGSKATSIPVQPAGVQFVTTVEDAVREADLAIDCVPDELESKLEILWLIDRMAPPKTVIATPTTRLEIADLAACTYRPEKCVALGLDPRDFSPDVRKMPIRTTGRTTAETRDLVHQFWLQLGFTVEFQTTV